MALTYDIRGGDPVFFFFSSRRRHTRFDCDWSSDVCSSDLNGVYDPASHLFYLGDRADGLKKEGAKGSIEIVDLKNGKLAGSIEVDGLNPAGLVLDPASPRMFVVMGDTSQVVGIDREKRKVIAMWPITGGPEPHAVDVDAAHHRLFIGSPVKPSPIYKPGKLWGAACASS